MSKRIAIVTGANKGLGFAIVKGLCERFEGKVYLTSRDKDRGIRACRNLENIGLKPSFHQLDVTNEESVLNFVSYIKNIGRVEILVNNAGVLFLKDAKESKEYQAQQTVRINFTALVNFTEAMLPLMEDNSKILNITSSSGHLSRIPSDKIKKKLSDEILSLEELRKLMNNYIEAVRSDCDLEEGWGDSPYVVSKNGVNAYTFLLNRRLKERGIIVNCVHPGYVMTDMTRGAGTVTPEQSAKICLKWALHPPGRGLYVWHNGSVVPWDGPDPRGYIDGKQ